MKKWKLIKYKYSSCYIYNGIIFPSLNHAKMLELTPDEPRSTSSSTVGQITYAVINTSNENKCLFLRKFWIYNFRRTLWLERMSVFFLGWWGMNQSAEQTNRMRTASQFTKFVCPRLEFITHEPRKKTLFLKLPQKRLRCCHFFTCTSLHRWKVHFLLTGGCLSIAAARARIVYFLPPDCAHCCGTS